MGNILIKNLLWSVVFFPVFLNAQEREIPRDTSNQSPTYWIAFDTVSGVYHTGTKDSSQVITTGLPNLKFSKNPLEFLGLIDDLDFTSVEFDTLPPIDSTVYANTIYKHGDKLVICRITHARTIFEPSTTPNLFATYQEQGDSILQWTEGEIVYPLDLRIYQDTIYECIQGHQTLNVWQPNAVGIINVLWKVWVDPNAPVEEPEECPAWVQPTGAHDAYLLNACVTYNGQEWINTGSNANVWTPGVFGWILK